MAASQAEIYFMRFDMLTIPIRVVGVLLAGGGVCLLGGFITPLAAALVGLISFALVLSWLPAPTPTIFENWFSTVFFIAVSTALAFLGPGAYSIDARLFGRREIVIPPLSHPTRN